MSASADSTNRQLVRTVKSAVRSVCPKSVLMWREAQYFRKYGEVELRLVRHLCRPHRDSIDVGANEGSYIHFMKRYSRLVYAFEPIPWLAEGLSGKFRNRVVVRNVALSSVAGMATLHIPIVGGKPVTGLSSLSEPMPMKPLEHREIRVPMQTLDDAYSGEVGFVKIDVEGHEEAVLVGASRTIARSRPRVLVEVEESRSPGAVQRVRNFFEALGYRGFFVLRNRLHPVDSFDPQAMQRPEDVAGYLGDLASHVPGVERKRFSGYVNNFLFIPGDEPGATFERIKAELARTR